MPIQALPYLLTLGFFYGSGLIADRFSIGQFAPVTYLSLRLGIASLVFTLIYTFSLKGKRWPRGTEIWKKSVLLGLFGTAAPMSLILLSLQYQSSGITAILITLGPAITVVLAHFFLGDERLEIWIGVGVGIAFVGALLLAALGESGLAGLEEFNPLGYLFVILAMIFAAIMTIYARKQMRHLDTFDVGAIRMMSAALVFLPFSIFIDKFDLSRVTQQGVFALGWATLFGTLLGITLEFYIVKRFGARVASMTTYIMLLVASIGGWLVLDEIITPGILAGMALIVFGILVTNRSQDNRAN